MEFHSDEEIAITLQHERLFGYCHICFSLCHEENKCNAFRTTEDGSNGPPTDPDAGAQMLNYKGALDSRHMKSLDGDKMGPTGKHKGKRMDFDAWEYHGNAWQ